MSDLVNELRDLHRNMLGIAYDRSIFLEAANRVEALEAALREVIVTMRHAHVFITSREKMHPTGVELYTELLDKLAALDKDASE